MRVKGHIKRQIQSGFTAQPFVPAVAGLTDSSEIMEGAFRQIDAPHAVRPGLGKVQPPFLTVQRDMMRKRDACLHGTFAVTCAPRLAVSGKGLDVSDR